jgi:hypothetical protein
MEAMAAVGGLSSAVYLSDRMLGSASATVTPSPGASATATTTGTKAAADSSGFGLPFVLAIGVLGWYLGKHKVLK